VSVRIVAPQTRCPVCQAPPLLRCRDTDGRPVDRVHRAREGRCEQAMAELVVSHELDRGPRTPGLFDRRPDACVVEHCGLGSTRHLSYGLTLAERVGGDPLDYVERRRAALDG
jgi:hypothetical protein